MQKIKTQKAIAQKTKDRSDKSLPDRTFTEALGSLFRKKDRHEEMRLMAAESTEMPELKKVEGEE